MNETEQLLNDMQQEIHLLVEVVAQRSRVQPTNIKELVDLDRTLFPLILRMTRSMKRVWNGLVGGFLHKPTIMRLIEQDQTIEVAYLHRQAILLEKIHRDQKMYLLYCNLYRELRRQSNQKDPQAKEDIINKILDEINTNHQKYRNDVLSLIRQEYPELLQLQGVGAEGRWNNVLTIIAAYVAFLHGVQKSQQDKSMQYITKGALSDSMWPAELQLHLLDQPYMRDYLDGKIGSQRALAEIKRHTAELERAGISEKSLTDYLGKLDDESKLTRVAGLNRLDLYLRKIGLGAATPEDKVRFIKSLTFDKFHHLLYSINSYLRGNEPKFKASDKKAVRSVIADTFGEKDEFEALNIDPPDNQLGELQNFFTRMQAEVSEATLPSWAVSTYFAIILIHPFLNGNGRTARAVYAIFRQNHLPKGEIGEMRVAARNLCYSIFQQALLSLCKEEGITANPRDIQFDYMAEHYGQTVLTTQVLWDLSARKVILETGGEDRGLVPLSVYQH